MRVLSKTATRVLLSLANNDRLVVATLRGGASDSDGSGDDWRASVAPSMEMPWYTVPIQTFRKMRRDGLLAKSREWLVSSSGLTHTEYTLTDAGRAALE